MAADRDATSPNNRITYRIDRGSKDNFQIAPQTGVVTVAAGANLDLDLYGSTYSLLVLAVDGDLPALTATVVVTVTVLDVDSKPPTFFAVGGGAEFSAVVKEDAEIGSVVRRCVAADPDQSALLRYQIDDGSIAGFDPFGSSVFDVDYLKVKGSSLLTDLGIEYNLVIVAPILYIYIYITIYVCKDPRVKTCVKKSLERLKFDCVNCP